MRFLDVVGAQIERNGFVDEFSLTVCWSVSLLILQLASLLTLVAIAVNAIAPHTSQRIRTSVTLLAPRAVAALRSVSRGLFGVGDAGLVLPAFVRIGFAASFLAVVVAALLVLSMSLSYHRTIDFLAPRIGELPGLASQGYNNTSSVIEAAGWEDSVLSQGLAYFVLNAKRFLLSSSGKLIVDCIVGIMRYTVISLYIVFAIVLCFRLYNLRRLGRKVMEAAVQQRAAVAAWYCPVTSTYPATISEQPFTLSALSPVVSARAGLGNTRLHLDAYFECNYLHEAGLFGVALLYSQLYAFTIHFWSLFVLFTIIPGAIAAFAFIYVYTAVTPEDGVQRLSEWALQKLRLVVLPYVIVLLGVIVQQRISVHRRRGIVHPRMFGVLFHTQMVLALSYGALIVIKRMALCFLGLLLDIGEIDVRFGVLDTDAVFQSYAGLFELLRIRAEFDMKVHAQFAGAAVAAFACTADSETLTQPLVEPSAHRVPYSCSIGPPCDEPDAATRSVRTLLRLWQARMQHARVADDPCDERVREVPTPGSGHFVGSAEI